MVFQSPSPSKHPTPLTLMTPSRPFTLSVLGSGSRGNATFIGHRKSGVLIDCGLSTKQIFRRLDAISASDTQISAVLLTHEHSDHVGAARILEAALQRRQGRPVPFYMTAGTARGVPKSSRPSSWVEIQAGCPFRVGQWLVEPLSIPHDTADPVAFTVQSGQYRAGVITDLGHVDDALRAQFSTLDIAVLEFNHDLLMLSQGAYPQRLKERVSGPYGHLSNEQAAALVRAAATPRLQHIILAHLSQDNNTIDKAYHACHNAVSQRALTHVNIHVASQAEPLTPIVLAQGPHARAIPLRPPPKAVQTSLFPETSFYDAEQPSR
jgi:phosphoribosyl 1,2-cyclic phosphodiesterase